MNFIETKKMMNQQKLEWYKSKNNKNNIWYNEHTY